MDIIKGRTQEERNTEHRHITCRTQAEETQKHRQKYGNNTGRINKEHRHISCRTQVHVEGTQKNLHNTEITQTEGTQKHRPKTAEHKGRQTVSRTGDKQRKTRGIDRI